MYTKAIYTEAIFNFRNSFFFDKKNHYKDYQKLKSITLFFSGFYNLYI